MVVPRSCTRRKCQMRRAWLQTQIVRTEWMNRAVELLLSAVLLAGLYATMAYGLGLIYGVLRIVNLNHGGMIMVGAYLGWYLHERAGIDPYLSLPIAAVVGFATGVV